MSGRLTDEFVERVRSESDIVSVVSGYVPMKKKGNRYWGCCPFHQENTPSFSVVPDQGFFYCFGCHAGGKRPTALPLFKAGNCQFQLIAGRVGHPAIIIAGALVESRMPECGGKIDRLADCASSIVVSTTMDFE